MKPVRQMEVHKGMTVEQLVSQMAGSGVFGAGRIAKAADIMRGMFEDRQCTVFLGAAGALVPGGMRRILIDMIRQGHIQVLVTTGANLTHDLVEALGHSHFQGTAGAKDEELHEQGIDRIYESFMPNEVYEAMEDFFKEHFDALSGSGNTRELLSRLGGILASDSILRACHDAKVPIFCPALADSGIGLMIWGHLAQGRKTSVNAFDDLREMMSLAWDCKRAGVIYLGGGVPKNFIQQAMQFSPKGADYGIQITMDRPEPGGSSGAELREGISWGKLSNEAKYVDVICDVTIALPLIYGAAETRFRKQQSKKGKGKRKQRQKR